MLKPQVMVAIPNTGTIRTGLAQWLLTRDPCECDVHVCPPRETQEKPISVNRKLIRQRFLDSQCDWLLQIDSDMEPANNLLGMVHNGVDVCSAAVNCLKGREIVRLAMKEVVPGSYRIQDGVGLYEVDAVGTGCMLASRKVMEAVEFPHVSDTIRAIDFEWCVRAKAKGFHIWYDTRWRCDQYVPFPV